MRKEKMLVFVLVGLYVASLFIFHSGHSSVPPFEERRNVVLTGLMSAIEDAQANGNYSCCIDPPCTMCYLGGWIWKDGVCRCDEMIASGQTDKVCPQCRQGLEDGTCKSAADQGIKCETNDI